MIGSSKDDEEKRFNETLKRMLETPPTPHKKGKKDAGRRPQRQQGGAIDDCKED